MSQVTNAPVKDFIERQILVGRIPAWILAQVGKHFPTAKVDVSHVMHYALLLKREGAISEDIYADTYTYIPVEPKPRKPRATKTEPEATPVKRSSTKQAKAATPAKTAKKPAATATGVKRRRTRVKTGGGEHTV